MLYATPNTPFKGPATLLLTDSDNPDEKPKELPYQAIDRKLAIVLGYQTSMLNKRGKLSVCTEHGANLDVYFTPTRNINDAWRIIEHFGLGHIIKRSDTSGNLVYEVTLVANGDS